VQTSRRLSTDALLEAAAVMDGCPLEVVSVIDRAVRHVARHVGLGRDQANELRQVVWLRLLQRPTIIQRFAGRSSLQTYMTTVVMRTFYSWRQGELGRWRPSAPAQRLGALAIDLERLISMDRFTVSEAIECVASRYNVTPRMLEPIVAAIRPHRSLRFARGALEASGETACDQLEVERAAYKVRRALISSLALLSDEDRALILAISVRDLGRSACARRLGKPVAQVQRQMRSALATLKAAMGTRGVDWATASLALRSPGFEMASCLRKLIEAPETERHRYRR
jgi:RNA polymerase sigma factor (sigma-70 family)